MTKSEPKRKTIYYAIVADNGERISITSSEISTDLKAIIARRDQLNYRMKKIKYGIIELRYHKEVKSIDFGRAMIEARK